MPGVQCLRKCVLAGSARSATKARTESFLQPTAKLLEYSNSREREKQSVLLRDLKLGMNNIDRAQLRRNGLLNPRHPTILLSLKAIVEEATFAKESGISVPGMTGSTLYRIRCIAIVAIDEEELDEDVLAPYKLEDGTQPKYFKEEWQIFRPFKDFQSLHKQLKTQVASTQQSASAGARLMGAATAAFTVGGSGGSSRRRKGLIPSLGQASKAGALGVTKKSVQKRVDILNGYLGYILSQNNLLNRCNEILTFLGAFYALPPEVKVNGDPFNNKLDPFGRSLMTRTVFDPEKMPSDEIRRLLTPRDRDIGSKAQETKVDLVGKAASAEPNAVQRSSSITPPTTEANQGTPTDDDEADPKSRVKEIDMIPSIKAKIDEVPLSQVRNAIFELVRNQFDFDNASFLRNRMLATLKTMSFAVTSSGEFRKMLYESHTKYVSADAIADWIKFGLDMLWPNGVFMSGAVPLTAEEQEELSQRAKSELPKAFPDQLRSVLGQEIVQGGMDMLHEMLQNRVILKSMFYMMFDMLWLEAFPELQDVLTGSTALTAE